MHWELNVMVAAGRSSGALRVAEQADGLWGLVRVPLACAGEVWQPQLLLKASLWPWTRCTCCFLCCRARINLCNVGASPAACPWLYSCVL